MTSFTFLAGTLALAGIPPLSGYFSKEEILGAANHGSPILFLLSLATVFFTAFYMGRLWAVAFGGKSHDSHSHKSHAHEPGPAIQIPLLILGVCSIAAGFFPMSFFIEAHETAGHGAAILDHHLLPWISVGLSAAAFVLAFVLFRKQGQVQERKADLSLLQTVLTKKYFFDEFYDTVVIRGIQENAARISDLFERSVVVQGAVNGTAFVTRKAGDLLRKFQTGVVQFYALVFCLSVTVILYLFILAGRS